MLIESEEFDRGRGPPSDWQDSAIFLYCKFRDLAIGSSGADGALMGCDLINIDWYRGSFNTAVLSQTGFEGCIFRGTSFRGCRFLECRFERCRFVLDNLGAHASLMIAALSNAYSINASSFLTARKGGWSFNPPDGTAALKRDAPD